MNLSKILRTILIAASIGTVVHWRFFDTAMVALGLVLLLMSPSRKKVFADIFTETKILNYALLLWLVIAFIGYLQIGAASNVLDWRWLVGFYFIAAACSQIKFTEDSKFSWLSLFMLLAIVAAAIYNYHETTLLPGHTNRFKGFFINTNVYGMALALTFTYLMGWLVSGIFFKKPLAKLDVALLLTIGTTVYLTYSRSSWMGIAVAFVAMTFLLRSDRKILGIFVALLIATALMFATDFMSLRERLLYTTDLSASSAGSIRIAIWKANIDMFLDHPFFGVGYWNNTQLLSQYSSAIPESDSKAHAHNQFLQALAGTGAIGLLCYCAILIIIGVYFFRNFQRENNLVIKRAAFSGLLVIICYSIMSLTDSPLDSREARNFLMLTLGASVGFIVSQKHTHTKTNPQ